ncbi:Tripartite DNA replication factor [Cichlidogyrus casuarinus]|uniref:Tripartite DNA replication factor n=1 Tax=Cichlidogyrus casuarinus TaxID=1844966 RepID=A0ABD2QEL2_9PLAT
MSEFRRLVHSYVPRVLKWIAMNVNQKVTPKQLQIVRILDIEESIWSPKYGLNGKIDVTARARLPNTSVEKIIPLEVKTGKASYSLEHAGQLLLYMLLLAERHPQSPNSGAGGLLVYLQQDASPIFAKSRDLIPPNSASFVGLLQKRNFVAKGLTDLIESISASECLPRLPDRIKREVICQNCAQLQVCSLLGQNSGEELFSNAVTHLKLSHLQFFLRWSRLQIMEFRDSGLPSQKIADILLGKITDQNCLRNLLLTGRRDAGQGKVELKFVSSEDIPPTVINGDFKILSLDSGLKVGLSLVTVSDVSSRQLTVLADSLLLDCEPKYRLDSYVSAKMVQRPLSSLVEFMLDSPLLSRLRELIIEGRKPSYQLTMSKSRVKLLTDLLRPLNLDQRSALIKVNQLLDNGNSSELRIIVE